MHEEHRQKLIKCAERYAEARQIVLSIPGTSVIEDIQYAMCLINEERKANTWPDKFKQKYDLSLAESPIKEALVAARILEEFSDLITVLHRDLNYDWCWAVNQTGILNKAIGYDNNLEECDSMEEKEEQKKQPIGKPDVGGPFELLNQDGKLTTNNDFRGKFMLVYFGFTHCPDICPEELDRMSEVIDRLYNDNEVGKVIVPIFISCDPQRDTVEAVREYLKDFHKDMVGLTGTFEQVAKVAKAYRVYFSRPPDVKEGEDYLVDHSIFFYLMDGNGEFLDVFGKNMTVEDITDKTKQYIKNYISDGGNLVPLEKKTK
ncbi:9763_t:CDS:2 [Paraglomus brasilianum]|uniref:9763_t:CDS:1 n=1 Tax=Paraglomus brasilianum TaxID=144538 RepID=A0A9N8VGA1_9GLOM|nr:9763_t:CDS:2 [Paraglomus brasilianum]